MKRAILVASMGTIIGIVEKLYWNISIVFLIAIGYALLAIWFHFKPKQKRYWKVLGQKQCIVFCFFAILANFYTAIWENQYQKVYQAPENWKVCGIVWKEMQEKPYSKQTIVKITTKPYQNKKIIVKCPKNVQDLPYGSLVQLEGNYEKPNPQKNDKGFDQQKYQKTKGVFGTLVVKKTTILQEQKIDGIHQTAYFLNQWIKNKCHQLLPKREASLFIGLLLGDTEEIEEDIAQDFVQSSLAHMLAVSGTHISYLVIGISFFFSYFGKRKARMFTVIGLVFFMYMTNFAASVVRACLMGIATLGGQILYRKSDIYTNMGLSCFLILLVNPYQILDIGLQLSYAGTLGIVLVYSLCQPWIRKSPKGIRPVCNILAITGSAQIAVFPLIAYYFQNISFTFFLSNLLATPILAILMLGGMGFVFLIFLAPTVGAWFSPVLAFLLRLLMKISHQVAQMPFSYVLIPAPAWGGLLLYYLVLFLFLQRQHIKQTQGEWRFLTSLQKKKIIWIKKIEQMKVKIGIGLICLILTIILGRQCFFLVNKKLDIFFVDVGQGDACLIRTPHQKNILIDGGGSENYDVGKNIVLPYLLKHGITKIDVLFISHFDTDHCGGLWYVLQNLKVDYIVLGKQMEINENYVDFQKIVKQKKIKVKMVTAGQQIKLENDLTCHVLWPETKKEIAENTINNQSLVFQLVYRKFTMLLTGDIEKIAEEKLIQKYGKTNALQSNLLKIPHHGSKTSSTDEFLQCVKPQVALIGVGKNHFGHPSEEVLNRLQEHQILYYRTDQQGEIHVAVLPNSQMEIQTFLP